MKAAVSDIIDLMDHIAPPSLAEEWDNAGLQVGDRRWTVRRVGVALDAGLEVVTAACQMKVDLLITHHPLIFKPLTAIDYQTPLGTIVKKAVQHRLSIFSAHTNLDKTKGGLNDILARRIGLLDCTVLAEAENPEHGGLTGEAEAVHKEKSESPGYHVGLGRVGTLPKTMMLKDFALGVKQQLNLDTIKVVGNAGLVVKKAAVCTGSGSSLLKAFFKSGAQVYVSGDLHFHDARDVEAADLGLIDIGHFPSEYLMVASLVKRLTQIITQNRLDVEVCACGNERDPFVVL